MRGRAHPGRSVRRSLRPVAVAVGCAAALAAAAGTTSTAASLGGLRASPLLRAQYPPPAVTPPPPSGSVPALETFAGTAAISSRPSDSGHTWIEHSPGFTRPASGQLRHSPGTTPFATVATGRGPYTASINVAGIGDGATVGIVVAGNADRSVAIQAAVRRSASTHTLTFTAPGLAGFTAPTPVSRASGGIGSLTVVRAADKVTATWDDGSTVATSTLVLTPAQQTTVASLGRAGVFLAGAASTSTVTRFAVNP